MNKIAYLIALLFSVSFFNISTSAAASRKDVKKIIDLISNSKKTTGMISKLMDNIYCEREINAPSLRCGLEITAVFIYDKTRYTFLMKKWDTTGVKLKTISSNRTKYKLDIWNKTGYELIIWSRPNGTKDLANLQTMRDDDSDGQVDFALIGKDGSSVCEKVYRSKKMRGGTLGTKYYRYWQRLYDKAIKAAIKHFKLNTKRTSKTIKVPIGYHWGSL